MKAAEMNLVLRTMFQQLIDEGYRNHTLCCCTLGNMSTPLFVKFMNGTDLGIKPLERMLQGFGYTLKLVPVKPEDIDTNKNLDEISSEFITNAKTMLVEYMDKNRQTSSRVPRGDGKIGQMFDQEMDDIFQDLGIIIKSEQNEFPTDPE